MNKLVEKRETERQVAPTPPPITPAEYQAELERFRQAAIRNTKPNLMGQVLRFRKGEWLFGSEKQKIEAGTRFVAIMNEVRHGWLKWNEDKTASHIVGKIVEGFKPPPRDSLDCRDQVGMEDRPQWQERGPVERSRLPASGIDGRRAAAHVLDHDEDRRAGVLEAHRSARLARAKTSRSIPDR